MGIYQTLYFPDNSGAEYNKRGKRWFKRAKGSDSKFYPVELSKQQYLDDYFKKFPRFYQYTTLAKVGGVMAIGVLGIVVLKMLKNGKTK